MPHASPPLPRLALAMVAAAILLAPYRAAAAGADHPTAEAQSEAWARDWGLPSTALEPGAFDDGGDARAVAHLLLAPVSAGSPVAAGIAFTLDPGWHVYWRNPGDSGMEPDVQWTSGVRSPGPLRWPAPETLLSGGGFLTTYGYSEHVVLPLTLEPSPDGELVADVDYLVCDVGGCIPQRSLLRRAVTSGTAGEASLLAEVTAALPLELGGPSDAPRSRWLHAEVVTSEQDGGAMRVGLTIETCPDCPRPTADTLARFVPDRGAPMTGIEATVLLGDVPQRWSVSLDGTATRFHPAPALRGVLVLDGVGAYEVDASWSALSASVAPVAVAPVAVAPSSAASSGGVPWWQALLFAFFGGALLNLMPCVLPILALKVAGFATIAHEERGALVLHGVGYAAGVIGSMVALASAVLGLRSVGTAVGWGFQFQQPWFLVALTLLFTAFATNLFGVWQLTVRTDRMGALHDRSHGAWRSVLEGVLAVLVATPCTAPLLGVAVGVALAAPAPLLVAVFVMLGAGLAAPYVVLTLVPAAQRIVPRPGAWMRHLKHGLGFALLGTAVWLLSVVASAYGASAAVGVLWLCVALAFSTWIWGVLQTQSTVANLGGAALVVACIGFGWPTTSGWSPSSAASGAADEGDSAAAGPWAPWSEAAVSEARAAGRPVFVDFTADWCISCKVNERRVLAREDVQAAFAARDTALLLADWTHRDETIRAALAAHGRAGVPLYLWYAPGADAPEVLPEILTRDGVLAVLERTVPVSPPTEVP